MADEPTPAPVELAVIEFPGSRFNAEIVPALAELVDDGIVRILDLVFVTKDADGAVTAVEINELDEEDAAALDDLEGEVNGLLSDEDLDQAGAALTPGSSALLIVREDTWARRLVDAVVGNPPFLGQMARATTRSGRSRHGGGPYADAAAYQDQQQAAAMQAAAEQAAAQQQATAAPAAPAGGNAVAEPERLAGLKSKGVLSHQEFAAAKAKLLGL
jgi:hypothetical protein